MSLARPGQVQDRSADARRRAWIVQHRRAHQQHAEHDDDQRAEATPNRQIRLSIRRRPGSRALRSLCPSSASLMASMISGNAVRSGDRTGDADQPFPQWQRHHLRGPQSDRCISAMRGSEPRASLNASRPRPP